MIKKASTKKIKISSLANVFIVSTAISLGLRVYQLFSGFINPENGTWRIQSFIVPLFFIVIAVASLIMLLLPFFSANIPKSVLIKRQCKALGIGGLVFTIGLIADASLQTGNLITAKSGLVGIDNFIKETGMTPNLVQVIFAFLAALYMLLFSISYLKGKNIYTNSKFLALSPMAWAIIRLVSRFMRPTNFRTNSELLLELTMLCFMMIFLFIFSRITSQIGHKGKMWMIFATGLPAAMFSILCSIPRLTLMFAGRADLLVKLSPLEIADISFAVFAVILIFTLINEYQSGRYEDYDEDDAFFDTTKKTDESLQQPVGEIIPPTFTTTANTNITENGETHIINANIPAIDDEDDEAFKIAEEYSNQYMSTASPLEKQQTEGEKDNDQTENKE